MNNRTITTVLFSTAAFIATTLLVFFGYQKMKAKPERPVFAEAEDEPAPKARASSSATSSAAATMASVRAVSSTQAPPERPMTLQEAFSAAEPGDASDTYHPSVGKLLTWTKANATWKTFFPGPSEVKPAVVVKDVDSNRGKKLCGSGRVEQIQVVPNSGGRSVALINDWRNRQYYSFATAFPSGDLVENSNAIFCGFVIGHRSFANVGGGTTLTIQLVGMYDLPETHPKGEPALAQW